MDHAVAVVAEVAQEGRQHGRGLRLGIVQQDDALAGGLQPLGEQLQLLLSASSAVPVAGPEVGAEHGDAALLQEFEGRRRHFEIGKAKERRARGRAWRCREAPSRPPRCPCRSRRSAASGFMYLRLGWVQVWWPMVWPWAAIVRTISGCSEAGLPIRKKVARTHSCASAASTFDVVRGPRPVVEGQHHLVVFERQRLRKTLQAHARRGRGIDGENARGAERVLARAFGGRCRRHPGHRGGDGRAQRVDELSGHSPLYIFGIALGVADWVMRAAIAQTSSLILSNRRGAAWPRISTLPRPRARSAQARARARPSPDAG